MVNTSKYREVLELMGEVMYPVGSLYFNVDDVNPESLFGGEWEKIEGRFLLGSSSTYPLKDANNENTVDGSADAVVVKHTHTQKPHTHIQNQHRHGLNRNFSDGSGGSVNAYTTNTNRVTSTKYTEYTTPTNQNTTAENYETGVNGTGKNMPPYIVVNMWRRTG